MKQYDPREVLKTILGNVGVTSALRDAVNNPNDFPTAFRSQFVIAKSFFYLGEGLELEEAVLRASQQYQKDPEDYCGSKFAYLDHTGTPAIVAVGKVGMISLNIDGKGWVRGDYSEMPTHMRPRVLDLVLRLIYRGMPMMGLIDILDMHCKDEEQLARNLGRLEAILQTQ